MFECHIGVAAGSLPSEEIDELGRLGTRWAHVVATLPGSGGLFDATGHRVEGSLELIGTFESTEWLDLRFYAKRAAKVLTGYQSCRLEVEAHAADLAHVATGPMLNDLATTLSACTPVPSPDYESHVRLPDGDLAVVGDYLAGTGWFELTRFGPERPKVVVTVGADSLRDLHTAVERIEHEVASSPIGPPARRAVHERVLGCWKPA